jgi:SAM-dependent methyltransferase
MTPSTVDYLKAMLSRIEAFQEHIHPVWDANAPFDTRIAGLPLYALTFNNYDRVDSLHGPTIAHYAPARSELRALARTIQSLDPQAAVLDIGCGNGFVGSLLAREGARVIGIDDLSWKLPQIPHFYDPICYKLRTPKSLSTYEGNVDVAFCSWMVPDANLTKEIVEREPSLIIHVYSPHDEDGGRRETGCTEAFVCPERYSVLGGWAVFTPGSFFSDLDEVYSSKPDKIRLVEIWCFSEQLRRVRFTPPEQGTSYDWDLERGILNDVRAERGLPLYAIRSFTLNEPRERLARFFQ